MNLFSVLLVCSCLVHLKCFIRLPNKADWPIANKCHWVNCVIELREWIRPTSAPSWRRRAWPRRTRGHVLCERFVCCCYDHHGNWSTAITRTPSVVLQPLWFGHLILARSQHGCVCNPARGRRGICSMPGGLSSQGCGLPKVTHQHTAFDQATAQ